MAENAAAALRSPMRTITLKPVCLAAIAAAILATGCCPDVDDFEQGQTEIDDTLDKEALDDIIVNEDGAWNRCEAACRELAMRNEEPLDEVSECTAMGDVLVDDPWNFANDEVAISCSGEWSTGGGFCTGRRPQGHHEVEAAIASTGTWLAVHAHLERASVRAFCELADWLASRGAPAELVARCRAAADDEVVHADLMTALAVGEGTEVPTCEADAPADDPFAVALHNAVEGCVHEAFAAIVAGLQARTADRSELRDVFARIADDELAHGQLAWDLHAWLMDRLAPEEQRAVERAQASALARLPEVIAKNARATPRGLGWPTPHRAAEMAEHFALLVRARPSASAQ